ncbi:transposase [Listeria monocytogenes]|nr:hypothetical protein [Listeria monocytogenes]EGI0427882.1 transposase [Listeria monocytogenes]EGI0446750.1 transposase [Listeria monocytogenes]
MSRTKEPKLVLHKNRSWEYFNAYVDKRLKGAETKQNYARRKIDVESAFGYLKASLHFTRLSVRGKEKVENELGFSLLTVKFSIFFYFQPKKQKQKSICTIFASAFSFSRRMS